MSEGVVGQTPSAVYGVRASGLAGVAPHYSAEGRVGAVLARRADESLGCSARAVVSLL